MILFPAIDLQNGKAVRLQQGDKNKSTIYADNPVETAIFWRQNGAKWLHVIDLDGAFAGKGVNRQILKEICSSVDIPVQFGGGIRSLGDCEFLLNCGAARLIIGTVALENPNLFAQMCSSFPGKIGVSLDAANGQLKTRGWLRESSESVNDVVPQLEEAGASFIIYTDINRDGMHTGLNLDALSKLLTLTNIPVIAAGGVSVLQDIKNACQISSFRKLQGVICGKALYDQTLDLQEAQAWLDEQQ